jgi:hypothetical protein
LAIFTGFLVIQYYVLLLQKFLNECFMNNTVNKTLRVSKNVEGEADREILQGGIYACRLILLALACFCIMLPATAQQHKRIPTPDKLMGHRYLTLNTVIRVNQIEVSRNRNEGMDERAVHTPEWVKSFREAVQTGLPGARITWAFSWLALHDTTAK